MDISKYQRAAQAIQSASGLVIGAGAGMGVDSGLPDFRGNEGFWKAYPRYRHLNCNFYDMANPRWFEDNPALAWGFYGHRRNLYRATTPHRGFQMLLDWSQNMPLGAQVYTSNVDFQFQRAGFGAKRVSEIHGSIEWNQCFAGCTDIPFPAGPDEIVIDEQTMLAQAPLPTCPHCGSLARPNILMFGDWGWSDVRDRLQEARLSCWLAGIEPETLVIIECGAGTAIPSVRRFCEGLFRSGRHTLIRINPREPEVPDGGIGIAGPALESLQKIEDQLALIS